MRVLIITNRRTKNKIRFNITGVNNEYKNLVNGEETNDLESLEHSLFEISTIHGVFKFEIIDIEQSKKPITDY